MQYSEGPKKQKLQLHRNSLRCAARKIIIIGLFCQRTILIWTSDFTANLANNSVRACFDVDEPHLHHSHTELLEKRDGWKSAQSPHQSCSGRVRDQSTVWDERRFAVQNIIVVVAVEKVASHAWVQLDFRLTLRLVDRTQRFELGRICWTHSRVGLNRRRKIPQATIYYAAVWNSDRVCTYREQMHESSLDLTQQQLRCIMHEQRTLTELI